MSLHDEIIDTAEELAVDGDLRTLEEIVDAVSDRVRVNLGYHTSYGRLAEAAYNRMCSLIAGGQEPVVLG